MASRLTVVLVALAALLCSAVAGAGKLDAIRDEVESDDDDSSSSSSSSSSSDDDDWDDDDDDGTYTSSSGSSAVGVAVLRIIGWPWSLPQLLVEGPKPPKGYFTGYPYENGAAGHMSILRFDPELELVHARPVPGSKPSDHVSFKLALKYGYDIDAVHQPGIDAAIDSSFRLGIQTAWTMLLEPLSTGELDRLTIGDINFTIRHVQHERVQMHTGLGLRLMLDSGRTTTGFNFLYEVDVFPVKPLIISAGIDLGSLGDAFMLHAHAEIGITFRGFEIFAGYDAMQIGRVIMHGPMGGLRIWI